jgi:hypothetical protein
MPAPTPIAATSLKHNVAIDLSVGATADITNGNSVPNNGNTLLVVTTGATPGTVHISYAGSVDGAVPADYNVLDTAGAALAASKTYGIPLGSIAAYGNSVKVTCSQATTKLAAYTH